jgi:DNA-binding HxlR family transcriptional regulator/putative sterol carrier protein
MVKERRSYEMRCGLAYALDTLGERWTLLVVRELLIRPRRYRELLDALPGIGTNLLADRLRVLTDVGIVRLVEPGRRTAGYALTEFGESLREPLLALARFGLELGSRDDGGPDGVTRADWAVLAIEAMVNPGAAEATEAYQFDVDGEVFHVAVAPGSAAVRPGPADDPALTLQTSADTFMNLGVRRIDPIEAVLTGDVVVGGDPTAVSRCLRLIGLAGPARTHDRSAVS